MCTSCTAPPASRPAGPPSAASTKFSPSGGPSGSAALALAVLAARVRAAAKDAVDVDRAGERRRQVGSGQRGDKVRTVRTQDGLVVCERTGKKHRLRDYLRGDLD